MTIIRNGRPIEVSLAEWPPRKGQTQTAGLLAELELRMECTPRAALAVPFDNEQEAKTMRKRLSVMMRARGMAGYMTLAVGKRPDGQIALYVKRGPNWSMPGQAREAKEKDNE